MQTLLEQLFPNVMASPDKFWESVWATVVMTGWRRGADVRDWSLSGAADGGAQAWRHSGMPGGVSDPGQGGEPDPLHSLCDPHCAIDVCDQGHYGDAHQVSRGDCPRVVGSSPFFPGRWRRRSSDIPAGLVEAASAMGSGPLGIIFRVYLEEGAAAIARGTTITLISLIGLTAMAGYVGAGGLGTHSHYLRVTIITAWILSGPRSSPLWCLYASSR